MSERTVIDILTNDECYEKYPDSQYRAFTQRLPNGNWLLRVVLGEPGDESLLYYELDGPPEFVGSGIALPAPPLRVMLRRIWRSHPISTPNFLCVYAAGYARRAFLSSRPGRAHRTVGRAPHALPNPAE